MFWFLVFIAFGWPVFLVTLIVTEKLFSKRSELLIQHLEEISLHGKHNPGMGFTSHKIARNAIKEYQEKYSG